MLLEVVQVADELGDNRFDVVVIGGGAAGLNGALMLARSRRSVVVIDSGAPRNTPAAGVHGLLGRDGMSPVELLERGRAEVRRYGGHVVAGNVHTVSREENAFAVSSADGRSVRARRLLVATGLVDELPDLPGLQARWGRDVLHCPYCHGWEVRDQAIGVLATGPRAVHQALLFRQLSADIILFQHMMSSVSDEEVEQLGARRIRVVVGEVASVQVDDDRLVGVRLTDGTAVSRDVLAVAPRMIARADFLAPTRTGWSPNTRRGSANTSRRTRPAEPTCPACGVAGNVTDLAAQVGAAAAAGALAAADINADLVAEDVRRCHLCGRSGGDPSLVRPSRLQCALLRVSGRVRFENLHVKTGAELSSQSRPQVGEGCALGMLRPRLRRLVLLDHDQSVASLVQRVELNPGFVVNSGDRRLESRDYVGAVLGDGKGRDDDDNAHARRSSRCG